MIYPLAAATCPCAQWFRLAQSNCSETNRKAIDTFLRYHFEQGLSRRHMTCEDIFVPELLAT